MQGLLRPFPAARPFRQLASTEILSSPHPGLFSYYKFDVAFYPRKLVPYPRCSSPSCPPPSDHSVLWLDANTPSSAASSRNTLSMTSAPIPLPPSGTS